METAPTTFAFSHSLENREEERGRKRRDGRPERVPELGTPKRSSRSSAKRSASSQVASPVSSPSAVSRKSRRSTRSRRSHRYNPYSTKSNSHRRTLKSVSFLTTNNFYKGISRNLEFGKDFLREMDCPLCLSKPVTLPLNFRDVTPGRCISLSPFGHNLVMEFQCETCAVDGEGGSQPPPRNRSIFNNNNKDDDLFSVTLAFYNNAGKTLVHKGFYMSLLSQSMDMVRRSFLQPSLLYSYLVIKTFSPQTIVPVFTSGDLGISMFVIFNSVNLHIGEPCIRLLSENVTNYHTSIDCSDEGIYVMKIAPLSMEMQKINIPEEEICDSIGKLDYTDELKREIVINTEIVGRMSKK